MRRCSYPKWGLGSPGSAGRTAAGSPAGSRGGPLARGNLGRGRTKWAGQDPRVAEGMGSTEGRTGSRTGKGRAVGGDREGVGTGGWIGKARWDIRKLMARRTVDLLLLSFSSHPLLQKAPRS